MNFFSNYPNYKFLSDQLFPEIKLEICVPRNFFITSFSENTRLFSYNGIIEKTLLIKPYHFNSKLGDFIFTRLQTSAIHLRKRKKREKKKRGKK